MKKPEEYKVYHHVRVDSNADYQHSAYTSIEVLQQIYGQPWDELALSLVSGLEPSAIRVSDGCVTCDAVTGRITFS